MNCEKAPEEKIIEELNRRDWKSFYFIDFDLSTDLSKGALNPDVQVFLKDENALDLWLEGFLLMDLVFNERPSFINTVFNDTRRKLSFHFQAQNVQSPNRIPCKPCKLAERTLTLVYSSPLASIKLPQNLPEVQSGCRKQYRLREILDLSHRVQTQQFNEEVKNKIRNEVDQICKICEEILRPSGSLSDQPYFTALRIGLAFVYPTEKFKSKALSVFVYPGYQLGNKEITVGGLVVLWNGTLPDDAVIRDISTLVNSWAATKTTFALLASVRSNALRAAIGAIMARNMSHIHGSHIEPGLQNRMDSFRKVIKDRLSPGEQNDNRSNFYKKLSEQLGIDTKVIRGLSEGHRNIEAGTTSDASMRAERLLYAIEEEAARQLSIYRQRKEDLIARMATDWPRWGLGMDFYQFFIKPLQENPYLIHFINLSDGIGLAQTRITFGISDDKGNVRFVRRSMNFEVNGEVCNTLEDADLVDLAIAGAKERLGARKSIRVNLVTDDGRQIYQSDLTLPSVRIREADIGVQAFFSFLEGVMRNAAKHRPEKGQNDQLELRIVLCPDTDCAQQLLNDISKPYNPISLPDDREKRFCYAIISANLDTLPRKVLMNGQKEPVDLVPFLRENLSKGIIDEAGKTDSENWGVKELKICAAFVSGANLEAVNSSRDYVWVTASPRSMWSDRKDKSPRLAYVLKLQKPRYVLAVVSSLPEGNTDRERWEWAGIKFVTAEGIPGADFDYDFLYVDSQVKSQVESELSKRAGKIPQRVVVGDLKWADFKSKPDKFVFAVYDVHLKKMFPGDKFKVWVYFEDDTLSDKWTKWWTEEIKSRTEGAESPLVDAIFSTISTRTEDKGSLDRDCESKKIYVLRHTKPTEILEGVIKPNFDCPGNFAKRIYFQSGTYSDLFFAQLCMLQPAFSGSLVLRQLVEAAALNVLVIDERIAQVAATQQVMEAGEQVALADKLYWMGIYIAKSVTINNTTHCFVSNNSNQKLREISMNDLLQGNGQEKRCFYIEKNFPVGVLLIHATKLKQFAEQMNCTNMQLIERLRDTIPYVIVHSGRGKTEGDIPASVPFLEYSIVQRYVLQEPSKFHLVQVALGARG